jgi:fructose-specific phosphotransferase system component IIB
MANIQAADINNLQNRIALVYGEGSGQNGYGQTLASSQVNATDGIIRASDINNIYTDILNARVHQVGPGDLSIARVTANLNTIAEDTSQFVNDDGLVSTDPEGELKGFEDFEDLISQVESDKFNVHPSQAEQKLELTDNRSARWNDVISHIFTVTFDDANHRRHFF